MNQVVTKYFFLLGILLLGVVGSTFALIQEDHSSRLLVNVSTPSDNYCVESQHSPHKFLLQSTQPSSDKKKTDNTVITGIEEEEEKDEKELFNQPVQSSSQLIAIFYALVLGYFFHYTKNCFSLGKRFTLFSSLRSLFILFRVFRI